MPNIWQTHTFSVNTSSDPTSTQVARSTATIRSKVRWISCDAASGRIISELPGMTSNVSRLLGAESSTDASHPIPIGGPLARGPQILQATAPMRTMVVAVINDVPAWAGWVLTRKGGSGGTLQLGCLTPEGYLGRRFVRDHRFDLVEQVELMSVLARDAEDIDGVGQGLGLVHDLTPTGMLRSESYFASDHATVLDRLQEMSRRRNGPEWTIDPEWADEDRTAVQLVLRIGRRIGQDTEATFDSEGAAQATYELTEDWSDGQGANWVEAYGGGEGEDQPTSDPWFDEEAVAAGAVIVERHFQPSSSITSKSVLNDHAESDLGRNKDGTDTWVVEVRWSEYPYYGVNWRLGDTVNFNLKGHRHPDGVVHTARVVGWELDMVAERIRPMLEVV